MLRFREPVLPDSKQDSEQALLQSLLLAQLPAECEIMRPTALRSIEEQRRLAFKPFLQRTWLDYMLYHVERLLVLVVIVFFTFWFIDGYGRDWLYQQSYINHQAAIGQTINLEPYTNESTGTHPISTTPFLPFTSPAVKRVPDYLIPQTIAIPAEPSDRRPYRLLIPAIGLDTPIKEVVIENDAWQVADYAAGYHHGSALPGDVGNTVLSGHAGLRGSVFRDLGNIREGNDMIVYAGEWQYRYQARQMERVWPTQIEVMNPTPVSVLTLITCTDWDTKRLVVIAHLIDSRPL